MIEYGLMIGLALITGCYSLISQAISLGYFPSLRIIHTSEKMAGQIYVAGVNWTLLVLTILVVVGFQSSSKITQAYGLTVCSGKEIILCYHFNIRHVVYSIRHETYMKWQIILLLF